MEDRGRAAFPRRSQQAPAEGEEDPAERRAPRRGRGRRTCPSRPAPRSHRRAPPCSRGSGAPWRGRPSRPAASAPRPSRSAPSEAAPAPRSGAASRGRRARTARAPAPRRSRWRPRSRRAAALRRRRRPARCSAGRAASDSRCRPGRRRALPTSASTAVSRLAVAARSVNEAADSARPNSSARGRAQPARRDRARRGPRPHQPVDVAVEHVVERGRAAAGEAEADERRRQQRRRGAAVRADCSAAGAREQQQHHDPGLRQRHVVAPRPGGNGLAAKRRGGECDGGCERQGGERDVRRPERRQRGSQEQHAGRGRRARRDADARRARRGAEPRAAGRRARPGSRCAEPPPDAPETTAARRGDRDRERAAAQPGPGRVVRAERRALGSRALARAAAEQHHPVDADREQQPDRHNGGEDSSGEEVGCHQVHESSSGRGSRRGVSTPGSSQR